jgi:anti-sigma regulatory factor (Ser/Thr protein kinase)
MPLPPMWQAEQEFAPGLLSARHARTFVADQLGVHRLDHLVDDATLVVSELVTNAVLHARTHLVVAISELPDRLRLAVHDNSGVLPVMGSAEADHTSGRGMTIVDACATDWGTERDAQGHKCVWATFSTSAPAPQA